MNKGFRVTLVGNDRNIAIASTIEHLCIVATPAMFAIAFTGKQRLLAKIGSNSAQVPLSQEVSFSVEK